MAEYNVWLERVRPLSIYLIVMLVVSALGLALRGQPPEAARGIGIAYVMVTFAAPLAVALRGRTTSAVILLGTLTPWRAVLLGVAGGLAGGAIALGLGTLTHGAAVPWAPIRPPQPDAHGAALALIVPNAIAAAIVFQAWAQTKLQLAVGVWGAAAATLGLYAFGDHSAIGAAYALAPVYLRATTGSLLACICASLTGAVLALW